MNQYLRVNVVQTVSFLTKLDSPCAIHVVALSREVTVAQATLDVTYARAKIQHAAFGIVHASLGSTLTMAAKVAQKGGTPLSLLRKVAKNAPKGIIQV